MIPFEFRPGDIVYNRRLRKAVRIHSRSLRSAGDWSYAYRVLETGDLYLAEVQRGDLQPLTILDRIIHDQEPPPADPLVHLLTRTAV